MNVNTDNTTNTLVSIIMPAYNSARYISEAIESILRQTMPDWELWVVDDHSTDNTTEIVRQYTERDSRIHMLSTPVNQGSGVARNLGIQAAQGRYIAFLDSDDWWYPHKLELQINWMRENNYEFTCTYYEDATSSLEPRLLVTPPQKQNFKQMSLGCLAGTPGIIYDTERIGKIYMPNLRRSQDWATWLLILQKVDFLYCLQQPLWRYRHVKDSVSRNKYKMLFAQVQVYKTILHYSTLRAWARVIFIFLPHNIAKKIKKAIIILRAY